MPDTTHVSTLADTYPLLERPVTAVLTTVLSEARPASPAADDARRSKGTIY